MLRGGFRTDSIASGSDKLMVEGDLYTGREGELAFFLPSMTSPGLVKVSHPVTLGGGFIESVWNHSYSERSDSTAQISFNRYRRGDSFKPETRDTLDLDYRHHFAWGSRQDLVWGVDFRYTTASIGGSLTVSYNPPGEADQVLTTFVQDEIALLPRRLYLTAGMKYETLEHFQDHDFIPSARLSWALTNRQTIWSAISRALRQPSPNDTDLVVNLGAFVGPGGTLNVVRFYGNPEFKDERLIAYEAGYRAVVRSRLSFDLAAYMNDYDRLQTTEPSAPFFEATPAPVHWVLPFTYQNLMEGETHGVEVSASWKVTDHWTLSPGYAFEALHMRTDPASVDTVTPLFVEKGTPRHSAQLRSHFDFRRGLAWGASAYFVDRLSHLGEAGLEAVPAYTRLDTALTWRAGERLSLEIVGQNLLKDHHPEFEDFFGSLDSGQMKRSAFLKVTWQF
jgi:iron complex outermembrane receptor protein